MLRCVPSGLTVISRWFARLEQQSKAIKFDRGDHEKESEPKCVARTRGEALRTVGSTSSFRPSTNATQRPFGDHCTPRASSGTSDAPGIPLCARGSGSPPSTGTAMRTESAYIGPSAVNGLRLKTSCVPSGEKLSMSSVVSSGLGTTTARPPRTPTNAIVSGARPQLQPCVTAAIFRVGERMNQVPGEMSGLGWPPRSGTLLTAKFETNRIRPPAAHSAGLQHPPPASLPARTM